MRKTARAGTIVFWIIICRHYYINKFPSEAAVKSLLPFGKMFNCCTKIAAIRPRLEQREAYLVYFLL